MKKLIVVPQGGLCNRLRVVLSAFELSCRGVAVRVEWEPDKDCRARYEDLFEAIKPIQKGQFFEIGRRRWYNRPQTRQNLHWPRLIRHWIYEREFVNFDLSKGDFLELLQMKNYFSGGCVMYDYSPSLSGLLRPRQHLMERIVATSCHFHSPIIGVHVRRTDNTKSIETSSDLAFKKAMFKVLESQPNCSFFLATDDMNFRLQMKKKWGNRIVMQSELNLNRNELAGIESAVVDLWLLSRTNRLLGSYWSSFSEMASEIGQIPLQIVQ